MSSWNIIQKFTATHLQKLMCNFLHLPFFMMLTDLMDELNKNSKQCHIFSGSNFILQGTFVKSFFLGLEFLMISTLIARDLCYFSLNGCFEFIIDFQNNVNDVNCC